MHPCVMLAFINLLVTAAPGLNIFSLGMNYTSSHTEQVHAKFFSRYFSCTSSH